MVRSIKVIAKRENQVEVTKLIDTFLEETKGVYDDDLNPA